jgi:serine/threonine protein kinase
MRSNHKLTPTYRQRDLRNCLQGSCLSDVCIFSRRVDRTRQGRAKSTGEIVAMIHERDDHRRASDEDYGIRGSTIREIVIIKGLNHPNIVQLRAVLCEDSKITVVFDYCHQDLHAYIYRSAGILDPFMVCTFMNQLRYGVAHLHEWKFHR